METKKLTLGQDKKIWGVCSGFAEYFDIDPMIIRLAVAMATLLGVGSPIILYILAALVMPEPSAEL